MNIKSIWVRVCNVFQVRRFALLPMLLVIASCNPNSDFNIGRSEIVITFSVGGTISGLTGAVLLNLDYGFNSEILTRTANGQFDFRARLRNGGSYDVTVHTHPSTQTCTVNNGRGTIASANIINIGVTCFTGNVPPPPVITTTSLPDANIFFPYDAAVQATGGVPPLTWSLEPGSGMLPPGLTLSNAGVISGSPTADGTYNLSVQVSDSSATSQTDTQALTIVVNSTPPPGLVITTVSLPNGVLGVSYNATVAAQGGLPPYSWTVSAGSLPPGLALLVTLGDIVGVPSQAGSFNFTIQVADVDAPPQQTTRDFSIVIANPLPTASSLTPNQQVAGGASFGMDVSGTGFVSGSEVLWNGTPLGTVFNSSVELRALVFNTDIATPGNAQVSVRNPAPGGGTSNALTFDILNPLPVLSVIMPDTANAGTAGFTLTATGSDFVPSSIVQWSGNARATTFVSSTELRAAISAVDIQVAANVPVTVFTPAPGGGTSAPLNFFVNPAAPPPPGVNAGVTDRISVSSSGASSNGNSGVTNAGQTLDISENGEFVVFESDGTNLDLNAPYQGVFVRRLSTGHTRQLARGWQGATPDNGSGGSVAMSGSGFWVAFESGANNLVANDTYLQGSEIFITHSCVPFDPVPVNCPEPEIASLSDEGLQPNSGASSQPDLNFDGTRLVFHSNSNLVAGINGAPGRIWLRDLANDTTELVSFDSDGNPQGGILPRISRNGRFVVYFSQGQVYLRDTCFGMGSSCPPSTMLASINNDGDPQSDGVFSGKSDISDNGRFVVFESNAPNLVPGNNTNWAIYLHDFVTGDTSSIPCTPTLNCVAPSISGDARFVSYDNGSNVYVHDTCIGAGAGCVPNSFLVSRVVGGAGGNDASDFARISADGFYVVFGSRATNLVLTGNNNRKHIFRAQTR